MNKSIFRVELIGKHLVVLYLILGSALTLNVVQSNYVTYGFSAIVLVLAIVYTRIRIFPLLMVSMYFLMVSTIAAYRLDPDHIFSRPVLHFYNVIVASYLAITFLKEDFFPYFENAVYYLSILSIPFYIIHQLAPSLMRQLSVLGIPITQEWLRDIGGISLVLYTFVPSFLMRNPGFMWEPGAYAMILVVSQAIRMIRVNRLDNRTIMYSLLVATTFSTMGYIAMSTLLFSFMSFTKRIALHYKVVMLLVLVSLAPTIANMDFMLPKIRRFVEAVDVYGYSMRTQAHYYNRFGYFVQVANYTAKWPTGIGWHSRLLTGESTAGDVGSGVGAVSDWLLRWGFIGVALIVISLYRSSTWSNNSFWERAVFTIVIIMAWFSNPISNSIWPYCILFYQFVGHQSAPKKRLQDY